MSDDSPEPPSSLRQRFLRLSTLLEKHECDIPLLLSELEQTMASLPYAHRVYLANKHLPGYVKSLLDARYANLPQFQRRMNEFFKEVMKWLLPMFTGDCPGALEVIRRLLNNEKDFYDIRFTSYLSEVEFTLQSLAETDRIAGEGDIEAIAACPEFLQIKHGGGINCFFAYNLNYFGRLGGFRKMLAVVGERPGVEIVNRVMSIVNQVVGFLYPSVGKDIGRAFLESAMDVILQSSDEDMRNFSKESLRLLVNSLESLESEIRLSEHGEVIERFDLEAGLKFLNSPYLDKRIYGLTCIIHIVERAMREEEGEKRPSTKRVMINAPPQDVELTTYPARSRGYLHRRWLQSTEVLSWFDGHNLISIIFGDKSHPELVRRSGELLKFLYRHGRVGREHLDRIWVTALGKHEAERDVTVALFKEVVPILNPEDCSHFFTRITNLPLPHVDSQVLSLLVTFVKPTPKPKSRSSRFLKITIPAPAPDLNTAICEEPDQPLMADASKPIALGYYPEESGGQTEEVEIEPENECGGLDPQAAAALDLLWNWGQAARGLKKETAMEALKHLQDLLRTSAKQDRWKYAEKCLANIRENVGVLASYATLKSIITSYPSYRGSSYAEETRAQFISRLDRDGLLFHELYSNFIWLKREFAHRLMAVLHTDIISEEDQRTDTQSSNSADTSDLQQYSEALLTLRLDSESDLTYYEEVGKRLEFLKFVYQNCVETIAPRQVYLLWDCFVVNAFSQREQDEFFTWFSGLVTGGWSAEYSVLEDDTVHTIYTEILLRLESRGFTAAAFECFEQYFLHVNKMHGFIDKQEFDDDLEVKDISLLGIDALWELILQVRSDSVSHQASLLLKKLYKGMSATGDAEAQSDMLNRCMGQIRAGAERLREGGDGEAVVRVSRALTLLSEFIEEFEGANDCGPSVQVTIQNTLIGAKEPKMFSMKLPHRMKLNDAREAIASKLSPPKSAMEILILHGGKVLDGKKGNRTLKELKVMDTNKLIISDSEDQYGFPSQPQYGFPSQSHAPDPSPLDAHKADKLSQLKAIFEKPDALLIAALKRTYWSVEEAVDLLMNEDTVADLEKEIKAAESPPHPAERSHLSQILSDNRDHFDLLFQLLGLGNNYVSAKVWRLLTQIPVNKDLFECLRNLAEGWEELLDQYCYYKLLYSLQIVNSFLESGGGEEEEQRTLWKSRFIQSGGFQHLYHILMTTSDSLFSSDQRQTTSKCLGFLLNVLKTFLSAALASSPFSTDGAELVEMVDLGGLVRKLVGLVEELGREEGDSDTVYVVENALGLLLPVAIYQPEVLEEIYHREGFRKTITTCLLSPHEKMRKSFSDTILALCSSLTGDPNLPTSPVSFFLSTLLDSLPTDPYSATDFFDLASRLIRMSELHYDSLLHDLIDFIESRSIFEDRRIQSQDKALAGVLSIVEALFDRSPEVISEFPSFPRTIYESLFDMPSITDIAQAVIPPKFKHSDTRRRAFSLLLLLSRASQAISRYILSKIHETHCETDYSRTAYDSGIAVKAGSGFVGLKNLGSTCYMNSLLQQLFCMPGFREGILEAETGEEKLEDNVLYQLQVLFANLKLSEKQYYTPRNFVKSLRDLEDQSLNVLVQQDVDEFFSLLCDRLETCMKSTPQEKLLRNLIGGTVVNIIESSEAELPYTSEREEQFLRLSMEIKNKKTLQEAMDLFIHADVLEGDNQYFCEQYDRKVNATRRVLIDSLANTLIIHLKRFEFDYTSSTRVKINDYCEFPADLNLQPWAREREGRPAAYYAYKLQGVLVHTGVAEAGHYYSLIADRGSGKWFEFNDNIVKEFRLEDIKDECFGGTGFAKTIWGPQSFTKSANAYLLVYERVSPFPYDPPPTPPTPSANFYKEISDRVTQENIDFLRDGQFFDQSYHQFLQSFAKAYKFPAQFNYQEWMSAAPDRSLIDYSNPVEVPDASEHDEGLILIQTVVHYAFELMTRAKHTEFFKEWMRVVMTLLERHVPASLWLLKKMTPGLFQVGNLVPGILLEERQAETRSLFADMIVQTVIQTMACEREIFREFVEVTVMNPGNKVHKRVKLQKASSARFFQYYITDLMIEARRNWRRFSEYFQALEKMVKSSEALRRFAVEEDLVDKLIEFFMNGNAPFAVDAKLVMGDQLDSLDLSAAVDLLSFLIPQCSTTSMIQRSKYPYYLSDLAPLSAISERHLSDYRVIHAFTTHHRSDSVSRIFSHLSYVNIDNTSAIMEELLLLMNANRGKWSYITPLVRLMNAVVLTPDNMMEERVRLLMTLPVGRAGVQQMTNTLFDLLYKVKDTNEMFVALVLAWVGDLVEREDVRRMVGMYRMKLQWIDKYVQGYDIRYLPQGTIEDYKGSTVHLLTALRRLRNHLALLLAEEVLIKNESSDDTEEDVPPGEGEDHSTNR